MGPAAKIGTEMYVLHTIRLGRSEPVHEPLALSALGIGNLRITKVEDPV